MTNFIILVVFAMLVIIAFEALGDRNYGLREYKYKRKDFLMSRAEHECYDSLVIAVADKYYVFPQVHLDAIVDNKVVGQNWRGAFMHINQKSVDFVLCDKAYIAPRLAIELDDCTHQRKDRKERDGEVERVLKTAGVPLLRLENHGGFNPHELFEKIENLILIDKSPQSTPL